MHLGKIYSKFDSRCRSYSERIANINSCKSNVEDWQFCYLTEVLISDVWQAWCHFCRELFLSSCRGCTARNGEKITAISGDKSWMRLGYIAKQASQNRNSTPGGHLNFAIRKEPTWGDLDVFLRIVDTIRPDNYQTLLFSYGSFSSLKHLQRVRNACAHKNVETISDISLLSTDYGFGRLGAATDIAWKNRLNSGEFAIEIWLYEMNLIADLSTERR